ncbi:MAG: OmpA family protein [Lentimicrobiaceae bacterium]|jgi:peptidoglycan-associated lipoprotein|nr:OmpA family protein [Lentimicrobiaceae bacterium]
MKTRFSIILIIILSSIQLTAFGQRRSPARNADNAFERKQYTIAAERYKKAYKRVKKNPDERDRINYQIAECYRLTGLYKKAEPLYRRVVKSEFPKNKPIFYLHYADVLKAIGKYNAAIENYAKYAELAPDDPRGILGVESTKLVEQWIANPSRYEITLLKKVNSKESSYAAAWSASSFNEIIFTSNRAKSFGKEKDGLTGYKFTDLFISKYDRKNGWSEAEPLDEDEVVNTKASEGTPFINSTFNTMYFTRCKNDPKRRSGCQIMTSTRSGRMWAEPVPVEIQGIDTLDVVGQPTLDEGELVMYFATDRKGGFGQNDIWVTSRKSRKEKFGRPMNIGQQINTKGNERFPFLRNDTTLYFASDGHGGMGGLDIFVSTRDTSGNWGTPQNLKSPVNSTSDDFGIVFHPEDERGFFASNRNSNKGTDNLYYFIEPPVIFCINGTVINTNTLQHIAGVQVSLIGSDGSSINTRTNEKGFFQFGIEPDKADDESNRTLRKQIKKNTTYQIVIENPAFFTTADTVSTKGMEFSRVFTTDFRLDPMPEEPIVLPDILYDLGRWELKPQYEDSLQGLIETLQLNPNITIELAAHTDNRDTEEKNDILSQRRAQSVVDYLIIRGIDAERLVAKGYGERAPRTLYKDYIVGRTKLPTGTKLTEEYIDKLPSEAKETAHQLNRRTEFRVLRKDYVPKATESGDGQVAISINPDDNKVGFAQNREGLFVIRALVNSFTEDVTYDRTGETSVSPDKAIQMLKDGIITKDDFLGDDVDKILSAGNVANNAEFIIKEIRIANRTIKDVKVVVYRNLRHSFVIDQATLKKFGDFEFDTKAHKLIFK